MAAAWSCFDDGSLDAAIQLTRQWLNETSNDEPNGAAALGWFLLSAGAFEEARSVLESALQHRYDHAPLHWYLGVLHFHEKRHEEARQELSIAVSLDPQLDDAAATLSWVLVELHRFEDAGRYAQQALKIKTSPQRMAQLGWILLCLDDVNEAAVHLAQALSREPQSTETRCHLATALQRMGKVNEALQVVADGLVHSPDASNLLCHQTEILLDLRRTSEARTACHRLLRQQACEGTSWYLFAKVLVQRGRPGLAARALARAGRLTPEQPDLWLKIGWAALESDNLPIARKAAERVLSLAPQESTSDILVALVMQTVGDLQAASEHAERAVTRDQQCAPAWRALAQIRTRQDRLDEAENALQVALNLDPGDTSDAHRQLGWIYLTERRYDDAAAAFRAALENDAKSAPAWYGLAETYRAHGKYADALRAIREALRLRDDQRDLTLRGQIIHEQIYHFLNRKWSALNGARQPQTVRQVEPDHPTATVANLTNAEVQYDYVICSLSTKSHVPLMNTLAKSVQRHFQGRIYLLVVDSDDPDLVPEGTTLVRLSDVIETAVWQEMASRYNILELCCALKSYLMRFLAKTVGRPIIYLDADTYLLAPLTPLLPKTPDFSVLLTPHLFTPLPGDSHAEEIGMLKVGVYNGGMVGVGLGEDGIRFLDWWLDRVTRYGYDSREHGVFTDQKWLDLVPCFFRSVHVSQAIGLNVGHWRVCSERDFDEDSKGNLQFCGEMVTHMHMSGFKSNRPDLLAQHIRPPLIQDSPLGKFLQRYAFEVLENRP